MAANVLIPTYRQPNIYLTDLSYNEKPKITAGTPGDAWAFLVSIVCCTVAFAIIVQLGAAYILAGAITITGTIMVTLKCVGVAFLANCVFLVLTGGPR